MYSSIIYDIIPLIVLVTTLVQLYLDTSKVSLSPASHHLVANINLLCKSRVECVSKGVVFAHF